MANDKKFVVKNGLQANNVAFVNESNSATVITASMLSSDTLSFSGNSGQLFSISDSMSGVIFAVNDISGIPSIEVDNTGDIRLAELSGNVSIGTSLDTSKLFVQGNAVINGAFTVNTGVVSFAANLTVGNSSVNSTVNSTTFSGTANNATNLGGSSLATIQGQITGNAATAYTNAVSYTDSKILTANSAITGNAATAYTNAVSYTDSKILTANSAITGNAATAYTNATTYASNASNISTGTLAFARLPSLYLGTTAIQSTSAAQAVSGITTLGAGNTTITGDLSVTGNTTLGDAATDNVTINANTITIAANSNIDAGTLYIDSLNNRVGINTTTPGSRLTVGGDFTVDTPLLTSAYINYTGSDSSTSAIMRVSKSGSDYLRVTTSGNIGIGNSTPTDKLSVNGTTYLGGNTTITGFANVVGSLIVSGNSGLPTGVGSSGPIITGVLGSPDIGKLYIGDGSGWRFNFASRTASTDTNRITFFDNGNVAFTNAVSGITTLAAGNTTITGFANVSTVVNSASFTIGTTLIANTLGIYHTGTVNAATLSVGTNFVANSLGVTTSNVSAQNLTLTGNLTVGGTTTTVSAQNLSVTDNMIYMNNGVDATITGLTANGTAIVFTANNNFAAGWDVVVTGITPSAYNATYTNITAANSTTFTVSSTTTGAYTSGGTARGKTDTNPDIGFAAGYNDGTYKHSGFFRDATDDYFKPFVGYTPEPDASPFIDTTNTSFTLAGMHANDLRIGNTSVYATINSTTYSGSANNATYLNGQLAAYYTNATNITTGTLPYAQIPANIVNTTAAFTFTGIHTHSANVVLGTSGISANGGFGTAGHVLHSNGTATYWAADDNTTYDLVAVANTAVNAGLLRLTDSSSSNDTITFTGTGTSNVSSNATHIIINSTDQYVGTVTSVSTGNGLTGGAITSTGTVSILANTGIVANSTGAFVNSAYIATISANNATYLNGQLASYYTNATNITTGTLPYAQLPANVINTTANFTISGQHTHNVASWGVIFRASNTTNFSGMRWEDTGGTVRAGWYRYDNSDLTLSQYDATGTYQRSPIIVSSSTGAVTLTSLSTSTGTFGGAVSGITTLSAGNTTITGFANVSVSVNSATLSVGSSFIANTSRVVIGTAVGLEANGSIGTAGQVLHSNGTSVYWAPDDNAGGTVTSIATANGLSGGTITTTGTLGVTTGSTLTVNTAGIHVNTNLSITSLALNGALSGVTTASMGNTIITGDLSANAYQQRASGVPRVNLGDPSVTEMALFDSQFNNKTEFYPPANVICETSTDGTTWSTYSVTDAQKKALVGGDSGASIAIPNGTAYFRVRFVNNGNYVYLNALYLYHTSGGHTTKVQMYKKDFGSTTWVQHTSSNVLVGSWPGHIYLPFSTIAYHPSTYVDEVAVVFIPTWNGTYPSNSITLHQMQIWGGYPAGKRNIYAVDSDKNVTFPAALTATTTLASGNTTITGFANASVSVNSALLTVGSSFIANTTGAYHTGTMNAASHTVGTSFVANSTYLTVGTATPYNSGLVTASAPDGKQAYTAQVANNSYSLFQGFNSAGALAFQVTGTGAITANGSLSGVTTLAAGNTTITGFANVSTSVNSASFTVGTTIVANTTLLYTAANVQVSTINATSFGVTLTSNTTTALITVGNSSVNATVNSTTFSGTANNATNLGGSSLATIQSQITGNAATAYTNATTYASNASNISSGTLAFARLPALYLGTTAIQSTSASQAVSGITTLAAGNTTITGFANVTTTLQVGTNTATFGTAAYLVSNGNFGLGTASPGTRLHVGSDYIISGTATSTNGTKILGGFYSGTEHLTTFGSEYSTGGAVLGYGVWPSTTTAGSFISSTAVALTRAAYTVTSDHTWYGGGTQTVAVGGALTTSERMRLTNAGNLGIANSAPTDKLSVNGTTYLQGVTTLSANLVMANNNITRPVLTGYTEHEVANTATTGTWTMDCGAANFFDLTLTGNITISPTNVPPSTRVWSGSIAAKQDATGGRTITWPSGTKWPGGVAPPATTTANAIDIWSVMTYDGGTTWIASLSVKNAS